MRVSLVTILITLSGILGCADKKTVVDQVQCGDVPDTAQAYVVTYPDGEDRKSHVYSCSNECYKIVPTNKELEDKSFVDCDL